MWTLLAVAAFVSIGLTLAAVVLTSFDFWALTNKERSRD
jgi:hypothetical protein